MLPEKIPQDEEEGKLRKILGSNYNIAIELGIDTINKLAMYTPVQLVELGLYNDIESAARVIRSARSAIEVPLILTRERREEYLKLPKLTTGVKSIDILLDGGLWPGKIYGVYGGEGTGKSRIAHQLCVMVQMEPIKGKAIYMDAEAIFNESIIINTAKKFNLDPDPILDNILVVNSSDYFYLEEFLRREWPDLLSQGYNLLIIDTLVGPYREAFAGRGHLAERQQRINATLNWIRNRIRYFNSYCLITNQIQAVPDPNRGIDSTYVGGQVLGHGITEWYVLKHAGSNIRVIAAYDVINKKTGESAKFKITENGLEGA